MTEIYPDSPEFDFTKFKTVDSNTDPRDLTLTDIIGTSLFGEKSRIKLNAPDCIYLLAFLDYGCDSCEKIWKSSRTRQKEIKNGEVIVVLKDLCELTDTADLSEGNTTVICSTDTWVKCKISSKSYVLAVRNGSVVTEGVAVSFDHLKKYYFKASNQQQDFEPN
jgi:hypothetical protein